MKITSSRPAFRDFAQILPAITVDYHCGLLKNMPVLCFLLTNYQAQRTEVPPVDGCSSKHLNHNAINH